MNRIPQRFLQAGISFLAGISMGLANAPTGWWFLAWIAMIPLWLEVWRRIQQRDCQFPWFACCWGLGYHGWTLFWITGLHPLMWMGIPWLGSITIALFCWLFITFWGTGLVVVWAWGNISLGIRSSEFGVSPSETLRERSSEVGVVLGGRGSEVEGQSLKVKGRGFSCRDTMRTEVGVGGNWRDRFGVVGSWKLKWVGLMEGVESGFVGRWCLLLVGVGLWCGLETLWSQGALYWGGLALTQSPHNLVILHLGQIAGPNTIVAAIVTINGLLAQSLISLTQTPNPKPQTPNSVRIASPQEKPRTPNPVRVASPQEKPRTQLRTPNPELRTLFFRIPNSEFRIPITLFLILHLTGFWLYSRPLADRPDASFKIGVIQANIPTWVKLTEQGVKASIVDYTQGYLALADQGVDGVLMPEGALPFVWEGDNRRYSALYRAIRDRGVLAWVGTFLAQPEAQPDPAEGRTMRYTQSLVAIAGDGEILSRYDKIKLVPLGEYIPFEGILGKILGRLSPLESVLVSGKTDQVFMSPWGPVAAAICYEPPFSGLIRRQVEAGGQFILTASNLDPYGQVLMAQHEAHDVMRSIETDRWLVRATNTGYSGFIDPHGRVQWRSEAARGVVHADWIYGRSSQTLYVRWGNWLTLVLLGLGILSYAKLFLN